MPHIAEGDLSVKVRISRRLAGVYFFAAIICTGSAVAIAHYSQSTLWPMVLEWFGGFVCGLAIATYLELRRSASFLLNKPFLASAIVISMGAYLVLRYSSETAIPAILEVSGGVACVLAIIAFIDIRDILNAIATRFVGTFPEHLRQIVDMVERAEHSILILTDCVDYGGMYPALHNKLFHALVDAREKRRRFEFLSPLRSLKARDSITVQFLVLGIPAPISIANRLRVLVGDGRADEPSTEYARREIKRFCQELEDHKPQFVRDRSQQFVTFRREAMSSDVSWHDPARKTLLLRFLDVLQDWEICELQSKTIRVDGKYLEQWQTKSRTTEGDLSVPIEIPLEGGSKTKPEFLYWIRDEKEAVLLFPHRGEDALAFVTHEHELVRHLLFHFKEKYRETLDREWTEQ